MHVQWRRVAIGISLAVAAQVVCAYLRSFHASYDVFYPDVDTPAWVTLLRHPVQALYWSLPAFIGALPIQRHKWLMGALVAILGPEFVNLALQPGLGFPPPPPGAPFNPLGFSGAAIGHAVTGVFAGAASAGFAGPPPPNNSFKPKPLRGSA